MELKEKEIITVVLDELVKRGFLHNDDDLKTKTKKMLRNLSRLDNSIRFYRRDIDRLEKSKNSIDGPKNYPNRSFKDEAHDTSANSLDAIETRINNLEKIISKIESFKALIDDVICEKLSPEDAVIIKRVYCANEKPEDIAIEMNRDESTVYRKLGRGIDAISIELFASSYIDNVLN